MTIVIAYTPDAAGEAALTAGITQAKERGEGVIVVNGTKGDALVDDRFSQGRTWEHVLADLDAAGVEHEERRPMGPDIAELILDAAEEVDATMVVVGLRRRTPVGKLILGSVSQRLLLDARCPVLAVKPPR
jgi:nucleotide-binding universal stress UspA family protein